MDKEQTEKIERFMMEIAESEEYKEVAYLAFSIRMNFFANCKCKLNTLVEQ